MGSSIKIIWIISLVGNIYTLIVAATNLIYTKLIKSRCVKKTDRALKNKSDLPLVSILIPARNEQSHIERCLDSALNQSYPNTEVILLDDNSCDNTAEIIRSIKAQNPKLQFLQGRTKPKEWLGKAWACYQLAQKAKGEYFLFIDADVELNKIAVQKSLTCISNQNLDLLSCSPKQIQKTIGEKILLPNLNWVLYSFLPLILMKITNQASISAAIGQFIFISQKGYKRLGGHKQVKNTPIDDIQLAREAKSTGLKALIIPGYELAKCRMYTSGKNALKGFARVIMPALNNKYLTAYFAAAALTLMLLIPFGGLIFDLSWSIILTIQFIQIFIVSLINNENITKNLLLYLPQRIALIFNIIYSAILWKGKKIFWKERKIS
jgi:chlorobactene glucosyltransferase